MFFKGFILLLTLSLWLPWSTTKARTFDFYLGVGNLSQFSGQVQTDDQGTTQFFSFKPTFSAGINYQFYRNFTVTPELTLTLPETGRDPNISKWQYFVTATGGYQLYDWNFRAGLGLALQRISGDGGYQTLSNGTTTTDFPLPESASVSRNVITTLGVQYAFLSNWSARFDALIYNLESGQNRNFSHTLTVIYHFGDLFEFEGDYRKTQKKRKVKRRKKRVKKTKTKS